MIYINCRPARNALYDQGYESVGLPVDPHLRLFALNWLQRLITCIQIYNVDVHLQEALEEVLQVVMHLYWWKFVTIAAYQ